MLRKILLIFLTFILTGLTCIAYEPCLKSGSIVKVSTKTPITTQNLEEGSKVNFIVPSDVWVLEKKAIEKGDIFIGEVTMLKMPIQGVNAALSIDIKGIKKINGEKRAIKGKLLFQGSEVLGGNLTNPASYNKSFYPRKVYGNIWGGTYKYVPSGEYEFGQHVRVDARSILYVRFDEDYYI